MPKVSPVEIDPEVHRQRLRATVKRARIDAGRTQPEVAAALDWSLSKVVRIEAGTVRLSSTDLRALLDHYGIQDPARVEELLNDARAARRPAWWAGYQGLLSREFVSYLGFEGSATRLRQFHASLVPGLLQTEAYARAVLAAVRDRDDVDRLVEARDRRQRLLDREDGFRADFVLDEAALLRSVGGRAVMREQLRHLEAMSRRPTVSIRVVPFEAGAHAGLDGSFVLLDVEDERVAYLEDAEGGVFRRDDAAATGRYLTRFRQLEEVAERIETILGRAGAEGGVPTRSEDAGR